MKQRFYRYTLMVLASIVSESAFSATASGTAGAEIETGIIEIQRQLNSISKDLRHLQNYGKAGSDFVADHKQASQQALERAIISLDRKQYQAAIQDFEYFLAIDQQSIPTQYLHAHQGIGKSFEALGLNRSAHYHYLMFVDIALSTENKEIDRLLDVLQRAVNLEIWSVTSPADSIETHISRLKALKASDPIVKDKLNYILGKLYFGRNDETTSRAYFHLDKKISLPPEFKGKALYLSGLMKAKKQDFEAAELEMSSALQEGAAADRDLFALGLARLYAHRKRYPQAVELYASVSPRSTFYQTALLERVHTGLLMNDLTSAKDAAEELIKKFPGSIDAKRAERMLGYIFMQEGNFASAEKYILTFDRQIQDLRVWLRENYGPNSTIKTGEIMELYAKLDAVLPESPILKKSYEVFSGIKEARLKLVTSKLMLNRQFMHVIQKSVDGVNPYWLAKSQQTSELGKHLCEVGHTLAAQERELYKDLMSKKDATSLDGLSRNLTKLLSLADSRIQQFSNWQHRYNYHLLLNQADEATQVMAELQARLAAIKTAPEGYRLTRAEEQSQKQDIETISMQLAQIVFELNSEQAKADLSASSLSMGSKRFVQASLMVDEMDTILAKYRGERRAGVDHSLYGDLSDAWGAWRNISQDLIAVQKKFREVFEGEISDQVESAQASYAALSEKEKELDQLTESVGQSFSRSLAFVMGHYENKIAEIVTTNQRWLGDVQWLQYEKSKKESAEHKGNYDAKRQEIIDRLNEINLEQVW